MAGAFGFAADKCALSMAATERVLLPRVRDAAPRHHHPGERLQLSRAERTGIGPSDCPRRGIADAVLDRCGLLTARIAAPFATINIGRRDAAGHAGVTVPIVARR